MDAPPGRRALNKQLTRRTIRRSAMALFKQRGFDGVTTSDIATTAGVSAATLFNYFGRKEDLFFGQVEELEHELAEAVAGVEPGDSIVSVLQSRVLHELTAGRATTNPPAVSSFHAICAASPSLRAREAEIYEARAVVLTRALAAAGQQPMVARLAARQYIAAEQLVADELRARLARGASPQEALDTLQEFVDEVFDLVRAGIGDLPSAGA